MKFLLGSPLFLLFTIFCDAFCLQEAMIGVINDKDVGSSGGQYYVKEICYNDIPNYEKELYSYTIQQTCYVHKDYMYFQKDGLNISRCGQCLEIKGPVGDPLYCVVAGYFYTNHTVNPDWLNKTVGVTQKGYDTIASTFNAAITISMIEVVLQPTTCPFKVFPKLYVKKQTDSYEITLFNSNAKDEKLVINKVEYQQNENGRYIIPQNKITSSSHVQIVSVEDDVISMTNVDLTQESYLTFPSRFITNTKSECRYCATLSIYDKEEGISDMRFFRWKLYTKINGLINRLEPTNKDVILSTTEDELSMFFYYGTLHQMSGSYQELQFEATLVSGILDLIHASLGANTNTKEFKESDILVDCDNLQFKQMTKTINGSEKVYIKVILDNSCTAFSNVFSLKFKTSSSTKFILERAHLIMNDDVVDKNCDWDSMNCANTQCTITNESYDDYTVSPWKEGCQPSCGTCSTGYVCTKSGMCVEEPNMNLRSNVAPLMITIIVLMNIFFI
ncbi:hypothetical protein ENUP19_0062G0035 [Entamoeba nuttalli]|uniref:ShKT domain-containing protein n=2 Tax=Entamoeba nuttalli TaxID=412467 RepID=K2GTH7_ENTNP|nr:hypothetical protein ENU1_169080 [Entamoeba nuttalli P19]EKE38358.1 hypothetical protein ENU1_169080 [Entamoeba nuttalli P19]|eukprot:XP_008859307.1 hypothetical protein ENU1_169080 [Entamoeba nuttalli P19]